MRTLKYDDDSTNYEISFYPSFSIFHQTNLVEFCRQNLKKRRRLHHLEAFEGGARPADTANLGE